jgi:hypothetical protein
MQRFEFFTRDGDEAPTLDEIASVLLDAGTRLEGGDGYIPGHWRDAATGARAVIDLGEAPIEVDVMHPPRSYLGWTPLHLVVQLPLVGPHWLAVEGYQLIERLLAGLPPGVKALDCEDIQEHKDAESGPFAWSRPRALASWERQHAVQIESRTDLARMGRGDSLRLWRWRRERAAGATSHPAALWPEATVLRDRATAEAHAVFLWSDPGRACALPGNGLVLLPLDKPRLIRREDLPAGEPLDKAGAALVQPMAWPAGLPIDRFSACDDEDWID